MTTRPPLSQSLPHYPNSPRLQLSSFSSNLALVTKPRRPRRNLAYISYIKVDQTDTDQSHSDFSYLLATPDSEHHTTPHRPRLYRLGALYSWLSLSFLHPNCYRLLSNQQIGTVIHNQKIIYRCDCLPLLNSSANLDWVLLHNYTYQQY